MQVVAVIESSFERFGIRRISRDGIVIDNHIECAAGAYPAIHGLPNFLAFFTVISGAFIWCQRAANDLDSVSVRSLDHLLRRSDQIIRRYRFTGGRIRSLGLADVVDALHNEQPFYARLANYIPIESRQSGC